MRSLVTSIFLCACESWTLTAELQRRIQAMEIRCSRKLLRISYKDHVTNEEVRAKIQQAIWPPNDRKETQTAVVWSCLPFIRSGQNHIARHSEREKKTRQIGEEVGNNIREWTGLEFGRSQRAVEKREKWRKLVANSSVAPQRPSRLRDSWWWW